MATRGRKSFTASAYKGSDELYDFPCTPCSKQGKHKDGVNFCVDCSEYYCVDCTEDHKKFVATSGHNVVDRARGKAGGKGKPPVALPTETCTDHAGERITTYCADHDQVVCNTCVSVVHRLCDQIHYIPKVAGGSKQSKDMAKVKQDISKSLQTMKQAKASIQKRQTKADQEKQEQLDHIKTYMEYITKHSHELETKAVSDVTAHYEDKTTELQTELTSIDDTITSLTDKLNKLDNAHITNESQVFVDINRGKHEVEKAVQVEEQAKNDYFENVSFKFAVDVDVSTFLNVKTLGALTEGPSYKVTQQGQYDIGTEEEENYAIVNGICELPNGMTAMADSINKCIKCLDQAYHITKVINMPDKPWGICQTVPNEVAVTYLDKRQVQFVNWKNNWKLGKSFSVLDGCRGICYSNNTLVVACGGHPGTSKYEPEGPGLIGVYDMKGSLLRKIQNDLQGRQMFSVPYHIVSSNNGNNLHITDKTNGVITVDKQGKLLWTFNENIKWAAGLHTITKDRLLVSGCKSNNIIMIGTDGKFETEILCQMDGIDVPISVFFSRRNSRLVVTFFQSNTIHVFNLAL